MPTIYLQKHLYDELINRRKNVSHFVNKSIAEALKKKQKKEVMTKKR